MIHLAPGAAFVTDDEYIPAEDADGVCGLVGNALFVFSHNPVDAKRTVSKLPFYSYLRTIQSTDSGVVTERVKGYHRITGPFYTSVLGFKPLTWSFEAERGSGESIAEAAQAAKYARNYYSQAETQYARLRAVYLTKALLSYFAYMSNEKELIRTVNLLLATVSDYADKRAEETLDRIKSLNDKISEAGSRLKMLNENFSVVEAKSRQYQTEMIAAEQLFKNLKDEIAATGAELSESSLVQTSQKVKRLRALVLEHDCALRAAKIIHY